MKTLLAFLALALCGLCFAADASTPRIVTLSSAPFPKAQIVSVDAATGTAVFSYLLANGTKADSGNSIARFTPLDPLPKDQPSDPTVYPDVDDATLKAAIEATH